jgi:succinoglycan biosynthesis transport protein ExoP
MRDLADLDQPRPPRSFSTGDPAGGDRTGERFEIHLLDYVRILYKRRWTALAAFVVVFLAVALFTVTTTALYDGRVTLLIDVEGPNVIDFKQVVDEDQTRNDYYQTQYSLLRSRSLAHRTLDGLKLWDRPPFASDTASGFSLGRVISGAVAGLRGLVHGNRADAGSPDESAAADETAAESQAINVFLSNVSVDPVRNSRLVQVVFRSTDPQMAADVANALAKNYIEQNLEFRFLSSKEAGDWLAGQLEQQRQKVEESEAELQKYREQHDSISLEDRENIVVQKLSDLNAAVTRAKTERIEKEALYNQLRSIQGNRAALDTFPAILSNSFIQQQKTQLATLQRQEAEMSEKLGDRHPDMVKLRSAIQEAQAKLDGEVAKVVESVRNEYRAAQAQETSLMAALDDQKKDALQLNRRAIQYGVLQRDVDSNRQIYESLLQRAKETGVSGALRTSNIRVIDPAEVPKSPSSPRTRTNLLLGLFGGGVLGIGLAFFFEYVDNRIKTPDEIKAHLGLPFLGMIPRIELPGAEPHSPLVNNGVPAGFAEAFKAVRTNILFSSAEEGARSVVVTSTGPSEGKTLVACNLAISLAQSGQRVLLVDADLRRPRVHNVFGLPQEPGLSNLMVGACKASESVRPSEVRNLWTVAAGRIPPNPAEIVGSRRFQDFLISLGSHFDWVIIDSPPVLAVTDASVVAHNASGVLFVVSAEKVNRHAARAALERLDGARARFFGAVLNQVNLDRDAYYYSQYYRREYSKYYVQ